MVLRKITALRRVKDKERKERKKWSYDITLLG
jgi:hypothetical protein